ncbi:MAG: TadE/TadG family type IV pilus assembly protein [Pseudomonadota bacterium]
MFKSSAITALRSRLGRIRRDEKGIAAVEFAIIVPIMAILFIGTIELSQAITVDRRVTKIASATADLIARTKQTTRCEVEGIMDIADEILNPYDPQPLRASIGNVVSSPTPPVQTTVSWAYQHKGGASGTNLVKDNNYVLPPGVVEPGDSVIVAEVEYNYTPLIFNEFITSNMRLEETFFLKPRLSAMIQYSESC